MRSPSSRSVPYEPGRHVVDRFDSGRPPLDEWLRTHAAHAKSLGTAGTFVWLASGQVVGYYALAPHRVARSDVAAAIGRGSPDAIPAYLIGKLALDRSLQGKGFGGALLLDALVRLVAVADHGPPARLLVVGAIDAEAAAFYAHFGFVAASDRPHALAMKVSTARAFLSNL